jgi:hypothetical protein
VAVKGRGREVRLRFGESVVAPDKNDSTLLPIGRNVPFN